MYAEHHSDKGYKPNSPVVPKWKVALVKTSNQRRDSPLQRTERCLTSICILFEHNQGGTAEKSLALEIGPSSLSGGGFFCLKIVSSKYCKEACHEVNHRLQKSWN